MSDFSGSAEDAAAAAVVAAAAAGGGQQPAGGADPNAEAVAAAAKAEEVKAAAAAAAQKEIDDAAQEAAAAKAAAEAARDAENAYEYKPTGDAGLDIALEFIGRLGFSASHPAVVQASQGKFDAISAAMAALGDKASGYERYLALAKGAFDLSKSKADAKRVADETAVYNAVGGKEAWDAIAAYTAANADEGEKVEIQAAMKAGGMQAAAMARLLQGAYLRANPSTPSVVKAEAGASAGAATAATATMSAKDYADQVKAIRNKTRGPIDNLPEYIALRNRYAAQAK